MDDLRMGCVKFQWNKFNLLCAKLNNKQIEIDITNQANAKGNWLDK